MTLLKIVISDTVLLALIGVVTSLIGAATTILTIWLNHRLGKIGKHINSRMDELLKITKAEAMAEGTLKGRADEKAEKSEKTESVVVHTPITTETKIEGEIKGVIKPNIKK